MKNTGCELVIPEGVPRTAPPTDWEPQLLHTRVDRRRVLKAYRLTVG